MKYQGICILCLSNSGRNIDLCRDCERDLPFLHPLRITCSSCGNRLYTHSNQPTICGHCLSNPPHFSHCLPYLEFQYPVNRLIKGFKLGKQFQKLTVLSQLYGQYLADYYSEHCSPSSKPELLLPVPMDFFKRLRRGFNQAELIAHQVSRQIKVPSLPSAIHRTMSVSRQSALNASERRQNLVGAFTLTRRGQQHLEQVTHVAIVDDVMTTGATCDELARVLKSAGVSRIDVYCLARTPLDKMQ